MKRTATINLPLHHGRCPRWLFAKMKKLCSLITEAIIYEYGPDILLEKLSSAWWFQAFGCVLGFDWHSSGLTTTLGGVLKESNSVLNRYGIYVCGGKAKAALKTPKEIMHFSSIINQNPENLIRASRLAAKVDNAALLDGFNLYHHNFIFTSNHKWIIIQQGMDRTSRFARRYHWSSDSLRDFSCEPHKEIITATHNFTLNMVAQEAQGARKTSVWLAQRRPEKNIKELSLLQKSTLPRRHAILLEDINPRFLHKIFLRTYESSCHNFSQLLELEGVGPKTIRALALISELIYGEALSFRDPARFSFAHGGKDGHPYAVNHEIYQKSLDILHKALMKAKIERSERLHALRRIYNFYNYHN